MLFEVRLVLLPLVWLLIGSLAKLQARLAEWITFDPARMIMTAGQVGTFWLLAGLVHSMAHSALHSTWSGVHRYKCFLVSGAIASLIIGGSLFVCKWADPLTGYRLSILDVCLWMGFAFLTGFAIRVTPSGSGSLGWRAGVFVAMLAVIAVILLGVCGSCLGMCNKLRW